MYLQPCGSRSKDVVVISLILIVGFFVVDSFLYPVLPNVLQYGVPSASSSSGESSAEEGFLLGHWSPPPAYLEELEEEPGVVYRNASWKPEIGHWLLQCGGSPMISVAEVGNLSLADIDGINYRKPSWSLIRSIAVTLCI